MNAPFNPAVAPTMSTLADKAMLVRLKISKWTPYAYDKDATAIVEITNGVSKAGRFNKRLMAMCTKLTEVNAAYNAVYLYHMRSTVPWLDDGVRMLPSTMYFEYTSEIQSLIAAADKVAEELSRDWAQYVANDIQRLGALADASNYPTSIDGMFRADVRFQPVPQEGDFRVAISDDDRASLAAAIREAESGVTAYLLGELMDPIRRLASRCDEFTGGKGERWHHSLVTNLDDLAQRLPRLNINNDPRIEAIINDLRASIRPYLTNEDTLKTDPLARQEAKAKMDELMAKMGAFMARG